MLEAIKKLDFAKILFIMFAVLNFKIMTSTKLLPVWYVGGIGNNRNALKGVGQLTYTGFIFPKTLRL